MTGVFESIFVRLLYRVRLGSPELILYLLTMMAHQGVFDLAVGLVEEVRGLRVMRAFFRA